MNITVYEIDNLTTERKDTIEIIQVVLKPVLWLHFWWDITKKSKGPKKQNNFNKFVLAVILVL